MTFLAAAGPLPIWEAPMKSRGSTSALSVTRGLRVPRVCQTTKQCTMARPPAQSVEKLNRRGVTWIDTWKSRTRKHVSCKRKDQKGDNINPKAVLFLDHFDAARAWGPLQYSLACEICGKEFSSRTSLADHRPVHEGRTFCNVCNKLCSTVANLRRHMKTHQSWKTLVLIQTCFNKPLLCPSLHGCGIVSFSLILLIQCLFLGEVGYYERGLYLGTFPPSAIPQHFPCDQCEKVKLLPLPKK